MNREDIECNSVWQNLAGFCLVVVPLIAIMWSVTARIIWFILKPIWE